MRSRVARVSTRVSVLVASMASVVLTGGVAVADTAGEPAVLENGPLDSLATPVGLTAVGLGVAGMVAGALRRKKATVQPQNQRRS